MVIHEHNHFDIRNVGGILLEKLVIKGGNQLNGRVRVSSAKMRCCLLLQLLY